MGTEQQEVAGAITDNQRPEIIVAQQWCAQLEVTRTEGWVQRDPKRAKEK